jgi:hypothetical protein
MSSRKKKGRKMMLTIGMYFKSIWEQLKMQQRWR